MSLEAEKVMQVEKIGQDCRESQEVWFAYEHFTNSRTSFERWLKCKFVKYCKNNKVLVQRKDCKNPSRVSIENVFTKKQERMKKQ